MGDSAESAGSAAARRKRGSELCAGASETTPAHTTKRAVMDVAIARISPIVLFLGEIYSGRYV
jgi:hypothetical protein